METNFPDCLNEGETVEKFLETVDKGKGQTARARTYVRAIAFRYVQRHAQIQLEVQTTRRQPLEPHTDSVEATAAVSATVPVPASASPGASVFVDAHWSRELENIEVQELDGTWRGVTLFRHKQEPTRVCIWFGKEEYEGIDQSHPYQYCPNTEILMDDEGFDINWSVQGLENDDDDEED